ncbi:isocitrate lyase/phosphoenolpyruvate mutase family protein [Piscinibacter sp. HJYY11]|uniref:isocitrate lyase/PEP mutase family protein n=1 Tax=Piscinibacter sp. HJYY11 TaxID=2801333 RepID=UPI00191D1F11|nr:isocitrate lyase/phosphoenolpyruvate mutase family protein [Piscinibacter sp. HJYY11]MBL0728812.1 isocitrate lyase/phosphoenolpyruvate mutase family protein [Piscinibacter sp. HJYY11]
MTTFLDLHRQPRALLMANAWDAGSAKLLAGLGFQAIATSSGASAMAAGKRDGELTRDEALAHAQAVVQAVALPVSADLENGFGPEPSAVTETLRLAIATGLAGGSIEDAPASGSPPYALDHAVERVAAAVEAIRASKQPFVLTARAENYLRERPDLDDTIRRLQAYEQAGADVLFAPGLPDLAAVRTVCAALSKPVSFMVGIPGKSFSVAELEEAGVKRISFATSFYRAAMRAARDAAKEVLERGTFTYTQQR